jgi:hypothetical protein
MIAGNPKEDSEVGSIAPLAMSSARCFSSA